MYVTMLEEAEAQVSPIASRTYPKGWSGEIRDDIARDWIEKRKCIPAADPSAKFSPSETVVLKAAAGQIMEQSQAAEVERMRADLEAMTVAELRQIAADHGVTLPAKSLKADIVAALIEDAKAKAAAMQAAAAAPAAGAA